MQRNMYDHKGNLEDGLSAQEIFISIAQERGWDIAKADKESDINCHWDILIAKGQVKYKIDVKAMKRIVRKDEQRQDKYHWVELHGVRKNDDGWLYGGEADFIAFETLKDFIIVKRERLIELIESKVNFSQNVLSPRDALYKVYNRKGRFDRLTLIPTEDLRKIAEWIWSKG